VEQEAPLPPADPALGGAPVDAAADEMPPMDAAAPAPMDAPADPAMGDTEEIDITDLVNMTKSLKKDIEGTQNDNSTVIGKMDDVFTKLDDLASKLSEMDTLVQKIEQLGVEVKQMKPETPQEKLEMRSLDSYPFNQKPNDFFSQKQEEMRASGKNEYKLTPYAFKLCLIRSKNSKIYAKYYLLLEQVFKNYQEYQIMYQNNIINGITTENKSLHKKIDNKIAGIAKPQASKINAITAIDTLKIAKKSFKVSPKFLFLTL
jgi:hypothetical protein